MAKRTKTPDRHESAKVCKQDRTSSVEARRRFKPGKQKPKKVKDRGDDVRWRTEDNLTSDPLMTGAGIWQTIGGAGVVIGPSQLVFNNPAAHATAQMGAPAPIDGQVYRYRLEVAVYNVTAGTVYVTFGGVTFYKDGGAGIFEGTLTASGGYSPRFIASELVGQWYIERLVIAKA